MINSKSEGQSRGPSWPQIPWIYELWKSHLSALLMNPIILISHLHSATAETPVSSCCKEIRVKSEAKLNHVLKHNPWVNYFACSLKIGFAFMKSIRLMTLINWEGKWGRSGENRNLKWFKHTNTSCSTMPAGLFCKLKCVHHSHFFCPRLTIHTKEKGC